MKNNESKLGKYVKCGNMMYQVVGVYNDDDKSNNAPAYIPFSVAQLLYNKGYGFGSLTFTLKGVTTEEENEAFEESFREWMARRHQFDPTDKNAIGMWNMANEFLMWNNIMNGITLFIWIICLGMQMAVVSFARDVFLLTMS